MKTNQEKTATNWRRQRVVALRKAGDTFQEIADEVGYHIVHVQKIYRQWRETGDVTPKTTASRHRAYMAWEKEEAFLKEIMSDQLTTGVQIRRRYEEKVGHGIGHDMIYRLLYPIPSAFVMGWVGAAAFVANVISAVLLMAFRNGDSNVRSVWLCTRNDAIANVAIVIAAGLVFWLGSGIPDLVVGFGIASLALHSSVQIVRQSAQELKQN